MQLCRNTSRHNLTKKKKKSLHKNNPQVSPEQRISTTRWSETKPRQTPTKFNIQNSMLLKEPPLMYTQLHYREARATRKTPTLSSKSTWF